MWKRSQFAFLGLSAASGLVIGALSLGGQAILPGILNQLANSGAVWSVIAFILGRRARSWQLAALAGFIALVGEVLGYFGVALLVAVPVSEVLVLFWLAVALVAGPVVGAAGFFSQHAGTVRQSLGAGVPGAIFIGEGLYFWTFLNYRDTALLWLALALGITALVAWRQRERLYPFAAALLLGLVFFVGELVLLWADQLRAGLFQN